MSMVDLSLVYTSFPARKSCSGIDLFGWADEQASRIKHTPTHLKPYTATHRPHSILNLSIS